jgi:spore maturation protein CgeB
MFQTPEQLAELRKQAPVAALCTETPYDIDRELVCAGLVDGGWTHERVSVPAFQAVNPNFGYLPHAWHPERHGLGEPDPSVPAHDVVLVGSGFGERIAWINAMDWTGIDLGLYGSWDGLRQKSPIRSFVRQAQVKNAMAAALYRRAKVSLNFYRKSKGFGAGAPRIAYAESLNPRAYELAACGAFHLSDPRAEVAEKFGDLVPTFTTAGEAEALIRQWLADDAGRAAVAAQLPARVAEDSWVHRARQVIGDLRLLLQPSEAA